MRIRKLFLFSILIIFLIGIISAQTSYCCERLEGNGPWCQNAPQEECDASYRAAPTSCEATSYCKLGTCINAKEGTCLPNTPQKVCEDGGGIWNEGTVSEIPQCKLGCCLIGEQAAFVTQTRCKKLSSVYGLEVNYRTDIQSETQCILSATADVKGACVFEREFERSCKMTTRKECQKRKAITPSATSQDQGILQGILGGGGEQQSITSSEAEFHEGYLCSAESLNTICGPRGGTTCVDGRDEVYFLDTCGNLANVYDFGKIDDATYWTYIAGTNGVVVNCGSGNNANSPTCGNCDYYLGSTCRKGNAQYENFICKNLACTYKGQTYQHGETWCASPTNDADTNSVGGRHFRLVCYNNEVSVEPCAEFRQEVCVQSTVNTFRTAACRVNKWQDCYSNDNQQDCENGDKRDCKWVNGTSILKDENGASLAFDAEGNAVEAACVPSYAPGFNFWEEDTEAVSMCGLANMQCNVVYEAGIKEGFFGASGDKGNAYDSDCIEKCKAENALAGTVGIIDICLAKPECKSKCVDSKGKILESWKDSMKTMCISLGDCGSKKNYIGQNGYYDWEKSFVRSNVSE
ncbi:hypothetical protein A3K74_02775 [Candidatus Pacearchaeota archaeon RBG_13_33_26]|nr:MAG: hypothetical protein A3K74_02775 [Candidatus Pacearchaeota archaeon RBG_13_33_26]